MTTSNVDYITAVEHNHAMIISMMEAEIKKPHVSEERKSDLAQRVDIIRAKYDHEPRSLT